MPSLAEVKRWPPAAIAQQGVLRLGPTRIPRFLITTWMN